MDRTALAVPDPVGRLHRHAYNTHLGSQASLGMTGYCVGNLEMSGAVAGIPFYRELCLDQYLHRTRRQGLRLRYDMIHDGDPTCGVRNI